MAAVAAVAAAEVADAAAAALAAVVQDLEAACHGRRHRLGARHRSVAGRDPRAVYRGPLAAALAPALVLPALAPAALGPVVWAAALLAVPLGRAAVQAAV